MKNLKNTKDSKRNLKGRSNYEKENEEITKVPLCKGDY